MTDDEYDARYEKRQKTLRAITIAFAAVALVGIIASVLIP